MIEGKRCEMTENDSGRVQLRDGVIHYESSIYGTWSLPLSEVRAVGEYTNQDGPGVDDWFLVFLTHGAAYEASLYAHRRDQFLEDLSAALGAEISCELVYSTDFRSHLLWPEHLKGHRLFEYRKRRLRFIVDSRIAPELWEMLAKDT
jgi:hypothetical protein